MKKVNHTFFNGYYCTLSLRVLVHVWEEVEANAIQFNASGWHTHLVADMSKNWGYNLQADESRIQHDNLSTHLVQPLQCAENTEAQDHPGKAEGRLEIFCTLHAHTSLFQELFSLMMQLWTTSRMCKNDQTGWINHFCLSGSQTLLNRCGQAASLTGKELVWSLRKKPPLPWMWLRNGAIPVTPDCDIWTALMLTRNGKLKDSQTSVNWTEAVCTSQTGKTACFPVKLRCGVSQETLDDGKSLNRFLPSNHNLLSTTLGSRDTERPHAFYCTMKRGALGKEFSHYSSPYPVYSPPSPTKPEKRAPPPTSPVSHLYLFPTLLSTLH